MCIYCDLRGYEVVEPHTQHGIQAEAAGGTALSKIEADDAQIIDQLQASFTSSSPGYKVSWGRDEVFYGFDFNGTSASFASQLDNPHAMTEVEVAQARIGFELWDDLIAIDLTETTSSSSADIYYDFYEQGGGGTFARFTNAVSYDVATRTYYLDEAEAWINAAWSTNNDDADQQFGAYGFFTALHEIGHTLGLSHPGVYNAGVGGAINYAISAEYRQDTRKYTVMSYFNVTDDGSGTDHVGADGIWSFASTPLLHDVLAIQDKYGADLTTRTEDTIYGFNATANRDVFDFTINLDPILAIWDAGGVDTLDVSGWSVRQHVDLREGQFSSVGALQDNIAIAYGAVIENGVGGSKGDRIIGNDADNLLIGGGGQDRVSGGDGVDELLGEGGKDTLLGQAGADLLRGGAGDDQLFGGGQDDDLSGQSGDDALFGEGGSDVLRGGGGDDRLDGGGGGDTLYGGGGEDRLAGGGAADVLFGGAGADVFVFDGTRAEGSDRVADFEDGIDKIEIGGDVTLDAMEIEGRGGDTRIAWADGSVRLEGIAPELISDADFIFA